MYLINEQLKSFERIEGYPGWGIFSRTIQSNMCHMLYICGVTNLNFCFFFIIFYKVDILISGISISVWEWYKCATGISALLKRKKKLVRKHTKYLRNDSQAFKENLHLIVTGHVMTNFMCWNSLYPSNWKCYSL